MLVHSYLNKMPSFGVTVSCLNKALYSLFVSCILINCSYPVRGLEQRSPLSNNAQLITLRMTQLDLANANGISSMTCLSFKLSGSFHIEKRTQTLPNPTATLSIYEGFLTDTQKADLMQYIKSPFLWTLSSHETVTIPTSAYAIDYAELTINRLDTVERVSYGMWLTKKQQDSLQDLAGQQQAKSALMPLIVLQNELRGHHVTYPDSHPMGCSK